MDNRKVNPWHQVLSKLNNLTSQLSEVAKAMNNLAESNRELVRTQALAMDMLLNSQTQAETEDIPPTSYLDGTPLRRTA